MEMIDCNYEVDKCNEENYKNLLYSIGLDPTYLMYGMTDSGLKGALLYGAFDVLAESMCIIQFDQYAISLVVISKLSGKQIKKIIRIYRNEIIKCKLKNRLINYGLKIETKDFKIGLDLYKVVNGFPGLKNSINTFKTWYDIG